MMERIREMAGGLVEEIVFTVDLPSRHQTQKVPMLDIAVWLEDREAGLAKRRRQLAC